jgi:DHA2 family multidrug resistance protein
MTHYEAHLPREAAAPLRMSMVVAGIVIASCMDAIAGTALAIGRIDMLGDTHATPDEFAIFDIAFIAARLTAFLVAPLFVIAIKPTACLRGGAAALLLSSAAMTFSVDIAWLGACRAVQGFAGGTILVAGQTLLFLRFPAERQPLIQAIFALGAVMAPATLAPALQGWLVDHLSWDLIFLSNIPLGIVSLLLLAADGSRTYKQEIRIPWPDIALLAVSATVLTYVLQQGSRFNWFDDGGISLLTAVGLLAAGFLIFRESATGSRDTLLPVSPLGNPDLRFGLIVSLIAGFALSGSAYLIPAFALNVLDFTATGAGALLLPSGAMLAFALLLAGFAIEKTGMKPLVLAPFGILFFAMAMWMLSGTASDSGVPDLTAALLLRGFGLGLLFMALTLITLGGLSAAALPFGVGLFNLGKQIGGLAGTASLQTYIDHLSVLNRTVLSAHLAGGDPALDQRLRGLTGLLSSNGLDAAAASRAALPVLKRMLDKQVATLSFNEAFLALVLLFVIAAPCMILAKRLIGRGAAAADASANP